MKVVFHAATLHKPHVATHPRQEFVDTNITGTLCFLEESVAAGVESFIYTSTTSVFGEARLRSWSDSKEIGSGTGIATRRLLELGANPLVAVEPDDRLADFLCYTLKCDALTVVRSTFENSVLPAAGFDLGFSATAFHWLREETALTKVADLLRPRGWWAMVWNDFGDPDRPDPFHEATKFLLNGPLSPLMGDREIPFAQDKEARLRALERTNAFDNIEHRSSAWRM